MGQFCRLKHVRMLSRDRYEGTGQTNQWLDLQRKVLLCSTGFRPWRGRRCCLIQWESIARFAMINRKQGKNSSFGLGSDETSSPRPYSHDLIDRELRNSLKNERWEETLWPRPATIYFGGRDGSFRGWLDSRQSAVNCIPVSIGPPHCF